MLRLAFSRSCRRQAPNHFRLTSLSLSRKNVIGNASSSRHLSNEAQSTSANSTEGWSYTGPPAFTKNFIRLRRIALSSLGLSVGLAPVIMAVEGSLPTTARVFFIATAFMTSIGGTSLMRYMGSSYVTHARLVGLHSSSPNSSPTQPKDGTGGGGHGQGGPVLELHTQTLFSRTRITRVYDTAFLTDTGRGFATIELASSVSYTPHAGEGGENGEGEETVAETLDETGKVLGRWIVAWSKDGQGQCRGVGSVVRYFSIPKEELPPLH